MGQAGWGEGEGSRVAVAAGDRGGRSEDGTAAAEDGTERGAASVEHVGLVALVALLLVGVVAAMVAGGEVKAGRDLAATIGKRLVCGPRLPDACRHHPLVPAYGWPVARLVRALAPPPLARPGPSGLPLVPVDFRRCRRESCAVASGPHLTASNRRTTAFTEVVDRRGSSGSIEVTYWLYRPTLGWERLVRRAGTADLAAAAGTEVLLSTDPALVPLETLPGRNHYEFPTDEAPPWRWHVGARYPGWSS